MKNNEIILTIAIPTYNRCERLAILIESITSQLDSFKNQIEVIICDNASTDKTEELVESYINVSQRIIYHRNVENVGMDGNFHKCFELASGKYFWMIGDDDYIIDNSIASIVSLLEGNTVYDIIALRVLGENQLSQIKKIIPSSLQYNSKGRDEFINSIGVMLSFISGVIVRNCKNELSPTITKFYGTHLIHLFWIFHLLRNGENFLVVEDKLVIAAVDNTGGYKLFTVFSSSLISILDYYFPRSSYTSLTLRGKACKFLLHFTTTPDKTNKFESENYIKVCDASFYDLGIYQYIYKFLFRNRILAKVFISLLNIRRKLSR